VQKYKSLNFTTVSQALQEKGGWDAIAKKPEWGLFKLGHTHPNKSNSGLMTLVLMAYDFSDKTRDLTLKDILNVSFQNWMLGLERGVSGLSDSTGTMMREMVLKGPSSFDAIFVYESVAIDYLKSAEGRWGELHIVYPKENMWNENPYYIIDAPWSSKEQRTAAEVFLSFLLTEPIQRESLKHGFRPANTNVPVIFAESPFTVYQRYGLQIEPGSTSESPKAEVINNLLAIWQRNQGGR
jgi:Ca-activated chloride channel family protein